MGLKNLQSVFSNVKNNLSSKKTLDERIVDSTTTLDDLIKIDPIINPDGTVNSVLNQKGDTITFTRKYSTNSTYTTTIDNPVSNVNGKGDRVKQREGELFQELGKNNDLGQGDLTLGSLFKHNHRGVAEGRESIVIRPAKADWWERTSTGEVAGTININRIGMGSTKDLDIKGHSSVMRTGLFSKFPEPYIVHNIPEKGQPVRDFISGIGNNRDILPFAASADDYGRLASFYLSTAGLLFIGKENLTNKLIGDGQYLLPPIPTPGYGNTGFLNFVNTTAQGLGGIGTLRKPFSTNASVLDLGRGVSIGGIQYSDRPKLRLEFGDLGDNLTIRQFETPTSAGLSLIAPKITTDKVRAPFTPFLDLGRAPRDTNYIDKISQTHPSPYIDKEIVKQDKIAPFKKGDFYLKIKDLRTIRSVVDGKVFPPQILYFRGYITGITENVSPSWNPVNYIGKSEAVYMYDRAERDLSFNLRVYPANDHEFKMMYTKLDVLTSLAYPNYKHPRGGEVEGPMRMQPPFAELYMAHIGNRAVGQFGFIKSITYTVNESGDWDALTALPRLFDIAITYQILNRKPPSMADKFYRTTV